MKTCTLCKIEKPLSDFPTRNRAKGTTQSRCKACFALYQADHYRRNAHKYKAGAARRRKGQSEKTRQFIASLKQACADCGDTHPAVLEFHHLDPSVKEANVSQMQGRRGITREAEKCVVLCANCHKKRHWTERNHGPSAGTAVAF